jgi:hypothetical protein
MRWPRLRPLLLAALAAACIVAPAAHANGDPASDYLITQTVFLPFESPVSDTTAEELKQLLVEAKQKGFEVRVALIATRGDLGAVPVLYNKPQRYADFLGQEIVYYYKGHLLVVMPNGYGFFKSGEKLSEDKKRLARLPPAGSTDGNALAVSAENAVRALAKRREITLETTPVESGSSKNRDRVQIVGGVILLCAIAFGARTLLGRRRKGESDPA